MVKRNRDSAEGKKEITGEREVDERMRTMFESTLSFLSNYEALHKIVKSKSLGEKALNNILMVGGIFDASSFFKKLKYDNRRGAGLDLVKFLKWKRKGKMDFHTGQILFKIYEGKFSAIRRLKQTCPESRDDRYKAIYKAVFAEAEQSQMLYNSFCFFMEKKHVKLTQKWNVPLVKTFTEAELVEIQKLIYAHPLISSRIYPSSPCPEHTIPLDTTTASGSSGAASSSSGAASVAE